MIEFKNLYKSRNAKYYYFVEILSSISFALSIIPIAVCTGLNLYSSALLAFAAMLLMLVLFFVHHLRFHIVKELDISFVALLLLSILITAVTLHFAKAIIWMKV